MSWWNAVATGATATASDLQELAGNSRWAEPELTGLSGNDALQQIATRRWTEAECWYSRRKEAGLASGPLSPMELSTALNRSWHLAPRGTTVVLLPVIDDTMRCLGRRAFVPEGLVLRHGWPRVLQALSDPPDRQDGAISLFRLR